MENIAIITNGSDRQNSWAQDIANNWMRLIDAEIEQTTLRVDCDRREGKDYPVVVRYLDTLRDYRNRAVAQLAKMTAKQIIDRYTAKQMLNDYVITTARKAAEREA